MAFIFPSNWTREGRNHLNYMSRQLDAVDTALGQIDDFSKTIDNTAFKIGATFENTSWDAEGANGTIAYLQIFLGAGMTSKRIINETFELKNQETLYVDYNDSPLVLKKGTLPPLSSIEYGVEGFYSDSKILLLSKYQGSWIGAIAPHFLAMAENETLPSSVEYPKLMAQKVSDGYYVYVRSSNNQTRYARYHIKSVDIPYSSSDDKSNVKVNTIYGVMSCRMEQDGTIVENEFLATTGAWDIAIRESGVSDGSGGIAHGDEIEHYMNVYVDGLLITEITEELKSYQRIEFVAASTVYRDSQTYSTLTPLARHFKSFYFDAARPGEMTMDSKVVMLRDATLLYAYLSMAPVSKHYTSRAISDIDLEENVLTRNSPIHEWRENIKRISVWGTNVHVRAEVLDMVSTGTPVSKVEETQYNKIYFNSITNGESVSNGDVLRTKTRFTIDTR